MPEIVEALIQAEGLDKFLSKESITSAEKIVDVIFHDKGDRIIRPMTPEKFRENLVGSVITEVFRVGKQIVFVLAKGRTTTYMTSHLRMTGRWLVNVPEEQLGHTRIMFKLSSGAVLRYSDVRVFGTIQLDHTWRGTEGVDVWDCDYTDLSNAAFENPKAKRMTIKQFILDQSIWTGLGNVYANETLHRARIHPGQPADSVVNDWAYLEHLIENMKATLYKGYQLGGLSLKDWFHVDGKPGNAQKHLVVYQQTSCTCGTKILKDHEKQFDSRATYYCPRCQRKRITAFSR
jgi:formamidopyrimidine-DNA glycosylase